MGRKVRFRPSRRYVLAAPAIGSYIGKDGAPTTDADFAYRISNREVAGFVARVVNGWCSHTHGGASPEPSEHYDVIEVDALEVDALEAAPEVETPEPAAPASIADLRRKFGGVS